MASEGGPTGIIVRPVDRDPNQLSTDLDFEFESLIGEPKEFQSPDFSWKCSYWCFDNSKRCCYICLAVTLAPITAFCIGITFANLAFSKIWCWTPILRSFSISCGFTRTVVRIIYTVLLNPLFESCGYVFSQIKIRIQKLPEGPEEIQELVYHV